MNFSTGKFTATAKGTYFFSFTGQAQFPTSSSLLSYKKKNSLFSVSSIRPTSFTNKAVTVCSKVERTVSNWLPSSHRHAPTATVTREGHVESIITKIKSRELC
jgi:hypothetical protein